LKISNPTYYLLVGVFVEEKSFKVSIVINNMQPLQLHPVFSVIDANPPTPQDEAVTKSLQAYLDEEAPLETEDEQRSREQLLVKMGRLFTSWVREVCIAKGIPEDEVDDPRLFVSGSYFLGVNQKGADLDTILVVPELVEREDFFSSDVTLGLVGTLQQAMREHNEITHILPIPTAKVPVIEITWSGIDIDVLLARVNRRPLPMNADELLDDSLLLRADEATVLSLNGPRVNNIIHKLVAHNHHTFILVLRALRLWAKRRGIYSNKLGFLGGVNFAILACIIVQIYPRGTASRLLLNLMHFMIEWKWPTPLRVVQPYEVHGSPHLNWHQSTSPRDRMPIITPAYPNFNSSFNVTMASLATMLREFDKFKNVVSQLLDKNQQPNNTSTTCSPQDWGEFFVPQPFFLRYKIYAALSLRADGSPDALKKWTGFCESRIRKFVEFLERLPLFEIFPFPKAFDLYEQEGTAANTTATTTTNTDTSDHENKIVTVTEPIIVGHRFFIGLRIDDYKANANVHIAHSHTVNLEGAIRPFLQLLLGWEEREETMTADIAIWKFKDLIRAFPGLVDVETMSPQEILETHFILQKEAQKEMESRYSSSASSSSNNMGGRNNSLLMDSSNAADDELLAEGETVDVGAAGGLSGEESLLMEGMAVISSNSSSNTNGGDGNGLLGDDGQQQISSSTNVGIDGVVKPNVKRTRNDIVVDITSLPDLSASLLAKRSGVHKTFEQQARPIGVKVVLDR
jgi:poly(A) polymerase